MPILVLMARAQRRSAALLASAILAILFLTLAPVDAQAAKRPKPGATTTSSTTTTSTTSTTTTSSTTTTTVATEPAPAPAPTYPNRFTETFSTSGWHTRMGLDTRPWHTSQVVAADGSAFLRVSFVKGTHNGSSWFFPTGDADAVHLSYKMRLSPNWDSSQSASNIKLPGFGTPLLDAAGVCLGGCGLVKGDGITSWSARGDMGQSGVPGYYVYDAVTPYGVGYRWSNQGAYQNTRWYTVDLYLTMNTPLAKDGTLTAYVDGRKVWEKTDFLFRLVDSLHAGNVWFDFYYGGSGVAPADMWIDIDDIVIEY